MTHLGLAVAFALASAVFRRYRRRPLFIAQLALAACTAHLISPAHGKAPDAATLDKIAKLSVPFVPNAGQWDARAAFAAHTFAGTLFVTTQGELVYSLPGKAVDDSETPDQNVGAACRDRPVCASAGRDKSLLQRRANSALP